jgi:hypothetical protein
MMPYCGECGYQIQESDVYCGSCGHKIEVEAPFLVELEESYLRSSFRDGSKTEKRKALLNLKTTQQLIDLAKCNNISLMRRGLFRRREARGRDEILNLLTGHDLDIDGLLLEIQEEFKDFPVKDARDETVRKFNQLFMNDVEWADENPDFYTVTSDYIILESNKLDAYLNRNSLFYLVKELEPDIKYPGLSYNSLKLFLKRGEKIKVCNKVFSTVNLLKCLMALENRETRFYHDDDQVYLINDLGESIILGKLEKSPSVRYSFESIVDQYSPEEDQSETKGGYLQTLRDLIELLDESSLFDLFHSEESGKTETATFPRDSITLIAAWRREVEDWQPGYIDYIIREINAWKWLRDSFPKPESHPILNAIMINLNLSRCEREKNLENLRSQLREMEDYEVDGSHRHVDKVNELLDVQLSWFKVKRRLRNDYCDLLEQLMDQGVPILPRLIPEKVKINEEDYELSRYIIQGELLPTQMQIMHRGEDPGYIPLISEYEEYRAGIKTREEQDAVMDKLSETSQWYFDIMRNTRILG